MTLARRVVAEGLGTALLVAGCAALIVAIWINLNAGNEILAGLLSPESPGRRGSRVDDATAYQAEGIVYGSRDSRDELQRGTARN